MRVHDALLVEGTTKFAILCYGIFRFGELDSAFGALSSTVDPTDSRIYKFVDDDWPNGLVLCEVLVTPEDDVLLATGRTLTRMMELESCLAAACMYDGAFGTYDDLLAPEFAPQTYAFCLSAGEPIINFDSSVLASEEWALIVAAARQRLK
mgnify:CR=1 FL=1